MTNARSLISLAVLRETARISGTCVLCAGGDEDKVVRWPAGTCSNRREKKFRLLLPRQFAEQEASLIRRGRLSGQLDEKKRGNTVQPDGHDTNVLL